MKSLAEIFDWVSERKISFIGSIGEDGFPYEKAMLPPRKIEGNKLYFTTNTSSLRVSQYGRISKANAYFFDKGRFKYEGILLLGIMEVLTDEQTKSEIWRDGDTMYYSKGVNDPDYCVLRFTAEKCRRYCNFKSEWIDVD